MGDNPPKDVFNIVEGKDGKAKWIKVGSAFTNKDGSINAILNSYPREGKLQIRERKSRGTGETNSNQPKGEAS